LDKSDKDERGKNRDLRVLEAFELEERRTGNEKRARDRDKKTTAADEQKTEEIAVEQSEEKRPPMPGEAEVSPKEISPQVRPKKRHVMEDRRLDRVDDHVRAQPDVFVEDRKGGTGFALRQDGA